jgi:hypothetical protein
MDINDIQPMSLAQMGIFVTEAYNYALASALLVPTLLGLCAALLATLILVLNKELAQFTAMPFSMVIGKVKSFWERRAMRKTKREEQEQSVIDALVAHIEACTLLDPEDKAACAKAKRRGSRVPFTRTDANLMYQRLARAIPDFKYAIQIFDAKTKAKESILNADRDEEGKIVPLPLPDVAEKGAEPTQNPRKTATFKLRSATP